MTRTISTRQRLIGVVVALFMALGLTVAMDTSPADAYSVDGTLVCGGGYASIVDIGGFTGDYAAISWLYWDGAEWQYWFTSDAVRMMLVGVPTISSQPGSGWYIAAYIHDWDRTTGRWQGNDRYAQTGFGTYYCQT